MATEKDVGIKIERAWHGLREAVEDRDVKLCVRYAMALNHYWKNDLISTKLEHDDIAIIQ